MRRDSIAVGIHKEQLRSSASARVGVKCAFRAAAAAAALASLAVSGAEVECARLPLTAPSAAVVDDPRPTIEWAPHAGAIAYRARILSRVPEGEQIAALDLHTRDTSIVPPRALARDRAVVRVQISALCASGEPVPSDPGYVFAIDATPRCATPSALEVERDGETIRLRWPRAQHATAYEVALFDAARGQSLGRLETPGTAARLNAGNAAVVASLRSLCGEIAGAWTASGVVPAITR